MRAKFLKNKNAPTTWLISYSVIILCVLILTTVLVSIYSTAVKKERRDFNDFVFESVTTSVNDVLSEVNNLRLSITRNNNLTNFLMSSGNVYNLEATYDVIDDFKTDKQLTANVNYFFIYLKDTDMVVSENGIMESYDYFVNFFNTEKITFEEWKEQISSIEYDKYISMPCVDKESQAFDASAFLFHVPIRTERAVGVILCDKKNFVKNIEKIKWKSLCDIYIYNGDGNLVISDKNSEEGKIPQTINDVKEYDNRKNVISRKSIFVDSFLWQVITIVPNSVLSRDIYIRQVVVIATIICSFILLYLLVLYLIRRNYRPIASIMSLFGIADTADEFKALHEKIDETLKTNRYLQKNMAQKEKELKSVAISKIIKGNLDHNALMEYNIFFKNEHYAILAFHCEDLSMLFADEKDMPDFEKSYYLRYIIENIMEEIFGEENITLYTTEINENVVCLINLTSDDALSLISKVTQKGINSIKQYFNTTLYYAVSDIYASILDLPAAYLQANEILKYKLLMKDNEDICYNQMKQRQGKSYIFDFEREKTLVRYIETGESEQAQKIVKMIFDDIQRNKGYSIDYIRYVIFDIASSVTKCANEIVGYEFDFTIEAQLCKNINEGKTLDEFRTAIEEYIKTICTYISQSGKKRKPQRCSFEDILEYVNENITDRNLCVAAIGDHFSLTPKHIARVFKENAKISLIDYIAKKRVEYAQKLIEENKYTVREISEMVGFGHERTFYRAQKKFKF